MRGGVQLRLWAIPLVWILVLLPTHYSTALRCQRSPEGRMGDRSPVDGRFFLKISGNSDSYIPNSQYTVSIQGQRSSQLPSKFTGFLLVAEPESRDPVSDSFVANQKQNEVGTFQTLGDSLTKYSEKCPNAVTHSSSLPKSEVQALWTAPPTKSGCVTIKATVIEHHDIWYMDDGPLSKTLCENVQESFDMQPPIIGKCCACDEAKYEVTFEGLWSRHTHPKDFPVNEWLTRFSDVIGASHTADYRFWDYGRHASEGLRQLAEHGATRVLESELKAEVGNKDPESNHIRTIIKARGISYPNLAGKTFAVFRVDNRHHLMSLVSMINPSPDWIVGVSGLELCQPNCSWVESKVLNLYPWDAGTDSGPTYNSPDQPTTPRDVIRRIRTNFPNDPRSPFYDQSGAEMKPLARLYLSRQRLYEKSCDSNGVEGGDDDAESDPCAVSAWSEYTPCSATCGKGHKRRQRWYRSQSRAESTGCTRKLSQTTVCHGARKHCRQGERKRVRVPSEYEPDPAQRDGPCGLTEWTSWSSCSSSCGWGFRVRSRKFKIKGAFKRCYQKLSARPDLQQTEECVGIAEGCPEVNTEVNSKEEDDPNCPTTPWSDWMECSVTCGRGIRIRTRKLLNSGEEQQDMAYTRVHNKRALWGSDDNADDEENGGEEEDPNNDDDDRDKGRSERNNEKCSHVSLIHEAECEGPIPSCEISEADARLICSLPKVVGPCRGYVERWFFDLSTKKCEPFGYTGCQGNRNNFETHQQCVRACNSYKEDLKRIDAILDEEDEEQNSVLSTNQTLYDVPLQDDDSDIYFGRGQFGGLDTENHKLTGDVPGTAKVTGDGSLSGYDGPTVPPHMRGNGIDEDLRENDRRNYGHAKNRGSNKDRRKPSRYNARESRFKEPEEWRGSNERRRNYDQNPNNDEVFDDVIEEPVGQIKKCEVTPWSEWSECSATCGRGFEQMSREIIQHPINGGRSCPRKLLKRRRCRNLKPCKHHSNQQNNYNEEDNVDDDDADSYESMNPTWGPGNPLPNVRKDCILSNWSPWTPCSGSCGENAVRQRTRSVIRLPSNGGAPCGPRIDRRPCELMPCPL